MSLHIHRFINLIKATEARAQRDLHMPLKDAQDLHADITRLLLTLQELQDKTSVEKQKNPIDTLEITGGSFKNPNISE